MTLRRLRRGKTPGRLPSLGHDYEAGHRTYVAKLGTGGEQWLRTKPFSAPPKDELATCLHSFAHVVSVLGLGVRAQVLDVGCGPGWMSELLARCGYSVTGVDVAEDMVQIARERVAAIPNPVGEGIDVVAEFHAMPVREMPWEVRFDAAILYDAMHHFDDELETLRVIRRTLVPGGRIYVHEGVRPPPGSDAEHALVEEMRKYGTLESPFDPEYLIDVLGNAGFEQITRLAEVDALFDLSQPKETGRTVTRLLKYPHMNILLAVNPVEAESAGEPDAFRCVFRAGPWREDPAELLLPLEVVNVGRAPWPAAGTRFPFKGSVNVAPYLSAERGRIELPRTPLPHSVPPGGSTAVTVRVSRSVLGEATELKLDLVREGIGWFEDFGAEPASVALP